MSRLAQARSVLTRFLNLSCCTVFLIWTHQCSALAILGRTVLWRSLSCSYRRTDRRSMHPNAHFISCELLSLPCAVGHGWTDTFRTTKWDRQYCSFLPVPTRIILFRELWYKSSPNQTVWQRHFADDEFCSLHQVLLHCKARVYCCGIWYLKYWSSRYAVAFLYQFVAQCFPSKQYNQWKYVSGSFKIYCVDFVHMM